MGCLAFFVVSIGVIDLAIALAAAFAAAVLVFPALGAPRAVRTIALVAAGGLILTSPLFVHPSQPPLRLVAALNAIALAVKLYDLHADTGRASRFTFLSFIAYLVNWFDLVPRKNVSHPDRAVDSRRLAAGLLLLGAGGVMLAIAFRVQWASLPFLLEHAVKVSSVYLVVAGAGAAAAAAWRFAGVATLDPMSCPEFASTPAEFWRRWNRPAQQFFYENVFKPCGGLRRPVRATLITFGVSAVVHEYVFGIAAGQFQGTQAAFFLLQGLGVAATLRVRPTGHYRVVGVVLTLTFVLASSVLFFRSVDAIVPFYNQSR